MPVMTETYSKGHSVRLVLRVDPPGIVALVTIRFRIIQQTIWRKDLNWDDQITRCVPREFFATVAELPELSSVTILRHISVINCMPYRSKCLLTLPTPHSPQSLISFTVVRRRHLPIFGPRLVRPELPSVIPSQNPTWM